MATANRKPPIVAPRKKAAVKKALVRAAPVDPENAGELEEDDLVLDMEGSANADAQLACAWRENDGAVQATCDQIAARGGAAVAVRADLRSVASLRAAVAQTEDRLGSLDILVNCAAVRPHAGAIDQVHLPVDPARGVRDAPQLGGERSYSSALVQR